MSNQEVVDFVETFRRHCRKTMEGDPRCLVTVRTIQALSTNIAHLLCEEARYRWLKLVQDEDVIIDDISCVVMELTSLLPFTSKRKNREEVPMVGLEAGVDDDLDDEIILKAAHRKDPLRSSVA
jgi:hypothetical protein